MEKIIILDFSDGEVYIKDYDTNIWEDAEEFLNEYGFSESECHWMTVPILKLNID